MAKRWTAEEIKLLRCAIPSKDLAENMDRSYWSIASKRRELNINVHDGVVAPEILSMEEKEYRIYKLARQLGVKIQ